MREGFEQTNSALSITTPFGADILLLDSFQGMEALSQLFRFSLEMHSADMTLAPATILGAAVTVKFAPKDGPVRYFNGIVSRFLHAGGNSAFAFYIAEMVPSLWLLSLTRDRKVYQNKSSADIIKEILGEFSITFDAQLTGTYVVQEYCVQFDETALDFISRLMEEDGIFYFFKFADGVHTMVLGDSATAHVACTDAETLNFYPNQGARPTIDVVTQLDFESKLVVQKIEVSDFDYLKPTTDLLAETSGALGKGKFFSFPGKHNVVADGTQRSKVLSEALQVQSEICRGTSYCYPLSAGVKFTLAGHSRTTLNAAMVVRQVTHSATASHYSNGFETFLASIAFRPPRVTASPKVAGSQTAMVVGPSGEEMWTDQYGRIKVQFPWDRVGVKDENSSCWVRVSQSWAGVSWGAFFLPRIGQEVVISYVDGDPDRPLVTGCVYNSENTTPITLPGMQTQSTIKSRSSKEGTAGNEIRMEDKKDAEELYLHAQKDMKVEIENDLSTSLVEGSETHTIEKGDRTLEVKTGKETYSVKGTRDITVTGDETHTNEANFTQEVKGDFTLKVTGNLVIDVTGTISIKSGSSLTTEAATEIANKSGTTFANKAGTALTNEAGTSLTNKAGLDLTNQAGTGLVNKAGTTLDNEGAMVTNKASAMQTVDGGGMLTLKGGLVKIN
jgi:type VI secretion system secreted protein VgrG